MICVADKGTMSSQHQQATAEAEIADMEVKLVYRERSIPALMTRDFLEATVGAVKTHIVNFEELAPITEQIDELALYLLLPMNELEELVETNKMSHYLEKLSYCLELRLQRRDKHA